MSNVLLEKMEDVNEFNEFQLKAKETAIFPEQHGLAYLSLGLFGEAGEVANQMKKFLRGDYDNRGPEVHATAVLKIVDECGDSLWYLSQLLLLIGSRFGDICNCSDFDEFQSRLVSRRPIHSAEHTCNEFGKYIGKICGTVSMAMVQKDDETYKACLELIPSYALDVLESITMILHHHGSRLSMAAESCLEKLKTRKDKRTIQGDKRDE